MTTPWNQRYAQRMERMGSSAIRELLKLTQRPNLISFAGGLPAPELFPVQQFDAATQKVLAEHGAAALQYSTTEGYLPLREFIVEQLHKQGVHATADNVLITSGSQQALDIVGKILLNPGDKVLTEQPTYLGALQAWRSYQADFVSVPADDDGLCVDDLPEALRVAPKFMYVLPNFQNPGGFTLSGERRKKLVETADQYGCPIIEDDPYQALRFEGDDLPSLLTMDAQRLNGAYGRYEQGNVIYLSTFSKTLAPGLRLAWMVAPADVIRRCVMAKQGIDLHTSSINQMVAYEVIQNGFLEEHVNLIRRVYRERRDVMLDAMTRFFPSDVTWTRPKGGLFLWARLPKGMDAADILAKAIENNVAFVPGTAFFPQGGGLNTMRLNFSNAQPEQIEIGIRRIGEVLHQHITSKEQLATSD
ncbi:MAG: PLP-dependent aminotransferase family protein [Ardenticatenaceae bacterium]|nr:PLP-dependent aminotransferase family protein [Anaerolineales bacterium]MCB8923891.1 PLP-dependent aminotransferase family protein [Ardenticatenaceae bacterium]MCB8990464.1 PLP-dependent aminotransferase family protein [Ardenticatenaceae bacterium]MCB9003478.1 PLP-dependent aminotransferase family protein [Ardenticatenaceae bacterium]